MGEKLTPRLAAVALALAVLPSALQAQSASLTFDQAAYVTGETVSITGGLWND